MTGSSSVLENGLNLLLKTLWIERGGGEGIQCFWKTEYTVVISKFVI